jgi:hypothetical protein
MQTMARKKMTAVAENNLATLQEVLSAPFDISFITVKPGATNREKTKALALAYADPRAYMIRLDEAVGAEGWHDEYTVSYPPNGNSVHVLCRLTVDGITKSDGGEEPLSDPNALCGAIAQAFKRACTKFGLGRYLYEMDQVWAAYDAEKKRFTNPDQIVQELYRRAGIR